MENKNILILSVGTRNKIVQYFKENITGKIICTDMSIYAPAIYEGDKFYIMPPVTDDEYINKVMDICEKERISAVFSLIDPELLILAKYEKEFRNRNIVLLQSPKNLLELSFDKFKFYKELLRKNYRTPTSYIDLNSVISDIEMQKINFPLFIKPNKGSASININLINSIDEMNTEFEKYDDLLIQEYIKGKEYGVDVFVDFISGEVISIFIKEKLKMRAGETDKSVSVRNNELYTLIEKFVEDMGYVGQIDIDIFEKDNKFYISEVNPRFGGGYPHAYQAGCNFPHYIYNNLLGIKNIADNYDYKTGTIMMKYNEIKFLNNVGENNE
ncbi:ATP-grasp domain-containing protein [Staphylococcus equorum]|uniref:ATP-grasp domain-containing protein n=1 Tax=Staphylococcus equorum TaxID=246432 RepID=UPI0008538E4D|nr:ATP-grasp domain-containing protein [Staphylococcus equorum]MDK9869818.1 ATP-grasp domain-containing protein [Staphylococcus equorum]OEK53478.1 carbamoyl phosphate synthase [Staphylococcus equorum]